MPSLNNLKGHIVKDGKIVYKEKLKKDLYFMVVVKYEDFYRGSNSANYNNSSQLAVTALVTNGDTIEWSNNAVTLKEAYTAKKQRALKTKGGYKVYQVKVQDKFMWIAVVSKKDLLKIALNNELSLIQRLLEYFYDKFNKPLK